MALRPRGGRDDPHAPAGRQRAARQRRAPGADCPAPCRGAGRPRPEPSRRLVAGAGPSRAPSGASRCRALGDAVIGRAGSRGNIERWCCAVPVYSDCGWRCFPFLRTQDSPPRADGRPSRLRPGHSLADPGDHRARELSLCDAREIFVGGSRRGSRPRRGRSPAYSGSSNISTTACGTSSLFRSRSCCGSPFTWSTPSKRGGPMSDRTFPIGFAPSANSRRWPAYRASRSSIPMIPFRRSWRRGSVSTPASLGIRSFRPASASATTCTSTSKFGWS